VTLEYQRRMRPEIADFIRLIYDKYSDHEAVKNYPNVRGIEKNVFFINHSETEVYFIIFFFLSNFL
jgi:hypothetical protein